MASALRTRADWLNCRRRSESTGKQKTPRDYFNRPAINGLDEVAVTLQEKNAIVIIDGKTGTVKTHFSAGKVTVENIDTKKDGALKFTGKMEDVARWEMTPSPVEFDMYYSY